MKQRKGTENGSGAARPRVLVVGAGAIGGFYGGKLSQAGCRVSVVTRSDYEIVREQGIQVSGVSGDFHFVPEEVFLHPGECLRPLDYILVGTKVLPEVDVVELIRPVVGPGTVIVLIQNGVEIEPPLVEAFPGREILSCVAYIAVSRTGPGRIFHQAYSRLVFGPFPSGTSQRAEELAAYLEASGVPCELTSDIVTERWSKLVWNGPFNPISVLGGGVDTRIMLDTPDLAALVRRVMEEVCRTAAATGHPLPDSVIEHNIQRTLDLTPYKPSMLLDFEAGRPMEVEAILGNAVRAARRERITVPCLETLYALLLSVDRQNRSKCRLPS